MTRYGGFFHFWGGDLLDIFIGYDKAEPVAFHTCVESIITNSSKPVRITPLYAPQLKFKNPVTKADYPPSNSFIFSRFLVPYMMSWQGKALFLDGDMVVEGDVAELFDLPMLDIGVRVVKHDYLPKSDRKYLNAVQQNYPRKNWSSVILWDCGYFPNRKLTPEFIGQTTGGYLHEFQWLRDEQIGELDFGWNVLADEENQATKNIKLIHYTRGTPCFRGFEFSQYADKWFHYNRLVNDHH